VRLVLVGDSHMEEAGLAPGLIDGLRAAGLEPVAIHATRGKGVRWYLDEGRLDRILEVHRPTVLVVELGANDSVTTSGSEYERRLGEFVTKAKAAGASIVWIGPPHATDAEVGRRHEAVANVQSLYFDGRGVPWIDARPMTADLQHARDGVHFIRTSYDEWARRLAPAVAAEVKALERRGKVMPIAVGLVAGLIIGGTVGAIVAFSR